MTGALPPGQLAVMLVVALIGVPVAGILHEATHALWVWPVASSVRYDWRQQYIEAEVPRTAWRQRWADLAGWAPLMVGCFTAVYLAHIGQPLHGPWTVRGLLEWGLWIAYTVTGGVSDYMPEISRDSASATS